MNSSTAVCSVLPHSTFSVVVQAVLGLLAFLSVFLRWTTFEKPRRDGETFILDAGRLFFAGSLGHFLNVFYSFAVEASNDGDQCKFYLVNYVVDFFLGVPATYLVLILTSMIAQRRGWASIRFRGRYTDDTGRTSVTIWFKQCMEFCLAIFITKTVLVIPLFAARKSAGMFGYLLIPSFVRESPRFELVFVMVLVPTVLNILQFLIFDQILKDSRSYHNATHREQVSFIPGGLGT